MLTHLTVGDRLEIYRVSGEGANPAFNYLGAMNVITGKEAKPFLSELSGPEKNNVREIREFAFREYHSTHSVDVAHIVSGLVGLTQGVQSGLTTLSQEHEIQLAIAWQKLRHTIKVVRESK